MIVPPVADHTGVPLLRRIVAVNCCVWPLCRVAPFGLTLIDGRFAASSVNDITRMTRPVAIQRIDVCVISSLLRPGAYEVAHTATVPPMAGHGERSVPGHTTPISAHCAVWRGGRKGGAGLPGRRRKDAIAMLMPGSRRDFQGNQRGSLEIQVSIFLSIAILKSCSVGVRSRPRDADAVKDHAHQSEPVLALTG